MVRTTLVNGVCENRYGMDFSAIDGSKYDPLTKRTYVTGSFTAVGSPVGFVAAVDPTTGEKKDFPQFTHVIGNNSIGGVITKIISDGNDGYYVAGEFTNVVDIGSTYAQVRYNLAKVRADLTLDPDFIPVVNSKVRDIVLGSSLFICGDFTLVNGQVRTCFAALDATTGELDSRAGFNLTIRQFTGGSLPTVNCMTMVGSQLIIAGRFEKVNDTFLDNFARIDTVVPGLDITFVLNTNGEVRSLVSVSNRLTYAGTFTQSNSLSRVRIAQADPPYNTPSDITSFDPAPDGTVNRLISVSGDIYVVGEFTTIAGQSRPAGVAAFVSNAITSLDPALQTFEGNPVATAQAIYSFDSGVYIAGTFEKVGGVERLGLAKVDTGGGLITDFSANIARLTTYNYFLEEGTIVTGMLGDSDLLLIYGAPRIINSVRRTFIAAFEEDGSLSDYNVEISLNAVNGYDISIDTNGDVYFTMACYEAGITVNGQERRGGAATDSDGNLLPWNPVTATFADPYTLCVRGSIVYIGGFLFTVGGDSDYEHFAATQKSTGALIPLSSNPAPDGAVQTIAVTDSFIYIGGWFDQVDDNLGSPVAVNGFAILSLSGAYQTDLGVSGEIPGLGDIYVNSIELNETETLLYMAGYFTTVQGQARQGLFSINTSNILQSWTSALFDQGAQALSISYDQSTIIVAGYSLQGSVTAMRLTELDLLGSATELNTLSARSSPQQNIWTVEKSRYFVYAFGFVLQLINTELTPIAFPTFFSDFNIFAGGQVCEQIGRYAVLGALNISGNRKGVGNFQLLADGDIGTDTSGLPILGSTGLSGQTGLVGRTGAYVLGIAGQSPQGVTGALPGATGIRGVTGLRGTTGLIGATGRSSAVGHTGLSGATGLMGFQNVEYTFSAPVNPSVANTLLPIDTFDAPVTVTLPTAASVGPGKFFYIYDVGTYAADPGNFLAGRGFSANPVTINTTGGDTINGVSSLLLNSFGEVVIVISNGISKYTASIPAARVIGVSLTGPTGVDGVTGVTFNG